MQHYEVIVGNIEIVYSGSDALKASAVYTDYQQQSEALIGRAAGKHVALLCASRIKHEYTPDKPKTDKPCDRCKAVTQTIRTEITANDNPVQIMDLCWPCQTTLDIMLKKFLIEVH